MEFLKPRQPVRKGDDGSRRDLMKARVTVTVRVAQWCRCHPIATYILASILWITVLYPHAVTAGFASYDDVPQIVQRAVSVSSCDEISCWLLSGCFLCTVFP